MIGGKKVQTINEQGWQVQGGNQFRSDKHMPFNEDNEWTLKITPHFGQFQAHLTISTSKNSRRAFWNRHAQLQKRVIPNGIFSLSFDMINLFSEAALPMPLYLIWNQDLFQYLVLSGFLLSCHFKAVPTYRESSDVNLIQKNFALSQSNLIMSISQN